MNKSFIMKFFLYLAIFVGFIILICIFNKNRFVEGFNQDQGEQTDKKILAADVKPNFINKLEWGDSPISSLGTNFLANTSGIKRGGLEPLLNSLGIDENNTNNVVGDTIERIDTMIDIQRAGGLAFLNSNNGILTSMSNNLYETYLNRIRFLEDIKKLLLKRCNRNSKTPCNFESSERGGILGF